MAQFFSVKAGVLVNLDHVVSVEHDATGFHSVSGQTKSVAIHLDSGRAIAVQESDGAYYQYWLDFLANPEAAIVAARQPNIEYEDIS